MDRHLGQDAVMDENQKKIATEIDLLQRELESLQTVQRLISCT